LVIVVEIRYRTNSWFNLDKRHSYKNDYSRFLALGEGSYIGLISIGRAGRFERPTPCAQGRLIPSFGHQ
jgi:hypothetical protein